jgi:hypothetical protein
MGPPHIHLSAALYNRTISSCHLVAVDIAIDRNLHIVVLCHLPTISELFIAQGFFVFASAFVRDGAVSGYIAPVKMGR